jgi:hypothetical protein
VPVAIPPVVGVGIVSGAGFLDTTKNPTIKIRRATTTQTITFRFIG